MDLVPKRPKRRRTSYIYFIKEYQKTLKQKHKNLSFVASSKLCAAKWKHLPANEKEKYVKLSAEDASRYKEELKNFTEEELMSFRKKKKDPNHPVRPMTGYLWFCSSKWKRVAQNNPHMTFAQVAREMSKLWANASPKVKQKFEDKAECDRLCYQKEKREYFRKLANKKSKRAKRCK